MNPKRKLASVVIPTYNRSKILNYTLASIRDQNIGKSLFEVLVVDDGSSDDTCAIVESYRDHLSIRYFYQDDRGYRVGSARNIGIRNAEGEIIIFIDSGVILHADCIAAHIAAHENSWQDIAVIGYIYDFKSEDAEGNLLLQKMEQGQAGEVMGLLASAGKYPDLREEVYRICDSDISRLPAPWVLFWTCNVSARRSNIIEAGLFDINFDSRWGMEDVDLGYNLYRNNVAYQLSRQASSIHYPHFSDTSSKLEQERHNKRYFHEKHSSMESEALLTHDTVNLNIYLCLQS
jgi:glycosyltransferase involved in cell wall biosynthesis